MTLIFISVGFIFIALLCLSFAIMHQRRVDAVASLNSMLVTVLFSIGIVPLWIAMAFLMVPVGLKAVSVLQNHYRFRKEDLTRGEKEAEAIRIVSTSRHALNHSGVCTVCHLSAVFIAKNDHPCKVR